MGRLPAIPGGIAPCLKAEAYSMAVEFGAPTPDAPAFLPPAAVLDAAAALIAAASSGLIA